MSRLSKIAPIAALAALAATAAPALAAPHAHRDSPDRYGHHTATPGKHYASFGQAAQIRRDIARLDNRIDTALARRMISAREGFALRQDVRNLNRMFAQYSRGGLSRMEALTLERQVAQLDRSFRIAMRDGNRRRG